MTIEKGWFIRSKEPNTIFWSLRPEADNGWVHDIEKALLFARKSDAEDYFINTFHSAMRANFEIAGVN